MTRMTEVDVHTSPIEITHPAALGLNVAVWFAAGRPGRLVVSGEVHRILGDAQATDEGWRMTAQSADGRVRVVEVERSAGSWRLVGARGI